MGSIMERWEFSGNPNPGLLWDLFWKRMPFELFFRNTGPPSPPPLQLSLLWKRQYDCFILSSFSIYFIIILFQSRSLTIKNLPYMMRWYSGHDLWMQERWQASQGKIGRWSLFPAMKYLQLFIIDWNRLPRFWIFCQNDPKFLIIICDCEPSPENKILIFINDMDNKVLKSYVIEIE